MIKSGYIKIPKKVGTTKRVPNMYHGVLFPQGVLNLSLRIPTSGVIRPSANYPERTEAAPMLSGSPTTSIR